MGWNTSGKGMVIEDKGMRQGDWCLCESGCACVCVLRIGLMCVLWGGG